MFLTVSKRFEFSASHRLYLKRWSPEENRDFFGRKSEGLYGHGHNYVAYFVFRGEVDEDNGMLINVTTIKERILPLLEARYDHKYLNADTSPFNDILPTPENVARELLKDAAKLFTDQTARPVVCHLIESPASAATAYADGRVERDIHLDFSAARRTFSPHLTEEENQKLFGIASSFAGHGHHYRLRLTLSGEVDPVHGMVLPDVEIQPVLDELHREFDHRNINSDVPGLKGQPITTEILARYIAGRLSGRLPFDRLRLNENDNFFVEYGRSGQALTGLRQSFTAAHRLHCASVDDSENLQLYGKCNNSFGHGHMYDVEVSLAGTIDERTGTLGDLDDDNRALAAVLADWDYKHLDKETPDFTDRPSTGENMIWLLSDKLEKVIPHRLHRVRLWETRNNRFTLRQDE